MRVFVSAKAAFPAQAEMLDLIETELTAAGHTCFLAPRELERRGLVPHFMQAIRAELQHSDLLLVLYAPELRGGLVELGMAYALHIPIWLLCQSGETVSRTALECASRVLGYRNLDDLRSQLQANRP